MTYRFFDFGAHADGRAALVAFTTLALDGATPDHPASVAVGLDGVAKLESSVMASLIAALRRLRDEGGTLAVVTRRDDIRASLRATGLDRVFTVVASASELELDAGSDAVPVAVAAHGRAARRVGSFVAALALVAIPLTVGAQDLAPATAVPAAGGMSSQAIVEKLVDRNPSLTSFEAHVNVKMHMTSFPWYSPRLEGATYFKRPNNYEVVFRSVPFWAKGFDKLYTDAGDPGSWERRFVVEVVGEATIAGKRDIELRMVQRVRGQIDHETVDVDPQKWVVDRVEYDYYNGGKIVLDQTFTDRDGYSLISEQHVDIKLPSVRAVGSAEYRDYRTNVAVDDAVFTKKP